MLELVAQILFDIFGKAILEGLFWLVAWGYAENAEARSRKKRERLLLIERGETGAILLRPSTAPAANPHELLRAASIVAGPSRSNCFAPATHRTKLKLRASYRFHRQSPE